MTQITPTKAFLQGLRRSLPFILVVVPFATLFGVVATEAGLNLIQTMGFTALVIAGAAQFASLQMMQDQIRQHLRPLNRRKLLSQKNRIHTATSQELLRHLLHEPHQHRRQLRFIQHFGRIQS